MKSLNLKWVIAHEPKYLFYRVAEDFKNIVNRICKTVNIDIEIMSDDEYNSKYNPEILANRHNLWKLLQDNDIQIAQMQTTSLARQCNEEMYVLDMPFLFEDHDHATDVLEGEIGQYLLNNFDKESRVKGLAFTYSGGFKLIPVNKKVSSLSDILGASLRSSMSSISQDTMTQFGFKPVPTEIDEISDAVYADKAIGGEHVAQRIFPDQCEEWISTVINTKHSLFLTSIVVNLDWWDSLDQEVKDVFTLAAFEAARNERELSILDGDISMTKLKNSGVNVIELSKDEVDSLKEKSKPIYEKYGKNFSKLQSIINKK